MVRVIMPEEFTTAPWKNGGGVTHEIVREAEGETYVWRVSIAEVSTDGPFSTFPGMARILTVIEGAGLELHTPDGVLHAQLLSPLPFSGDLPVNSHMVNGAIRDLNLIYDPEEIDASVEVIEGPARIGSSLAQTGVLNLDGDVTLGDARLPTGAFGLGQGVPLTLGRYARCILVRLRRKDVDLAP